MATFGKTDDGASTTASSTDRKYVSAATPATSGTITSASGRIWLSAAGTGHGKFIIYEDLVGVPGALFAVSDEFTYTDTTEVVQTANFTGAYLNKAIVGSTQYWIGVHMEDPGTPSFTISRANTSNVVSRSADTYSDGPTDPFGVPTTENGPLDIYVTYAENATGRDLTRMSLLGVA